MDDLDLEECTNLECNAVIECLECFRCYACCESGCPLEPYDSWMKAGVEEGLRKIFNDRLKKEES